MKQLYALLFLLFSLSSFGQNPIVLENQKTGNPISEWGVPDFRDNRIAGFSTKMSLNSGETVRFKISVEASATYTLKIYRIGYYGGDGARLVQDLGTLNGVAQPAGISDPATGQLDCSNWSESASWAIPASAVSGLYIAKLERTGGGSNHIAFVVRNDISHSDLYFQMPDATWQAYNGYGGNSLYDGNTAGFPNGHAVKVSYNRPFFPYNSLFNIEGREADWYMNAVYPMIRWLERNGYDVTYTSCNDVDQNGNRLLNHKVFLSVGHDEYWSKNQRANVEAARDAGVHLAFFSGNEVYWKTRWEANDGTEDRNLVCYKEGLLADGSNAERACGTKCDPSSPEWTGLWRTGDAYDAGKPENGLTGQISWIEFPSEIGVPERYKKLRFWRNTSIVNLLQGQTAFLGFQTLGYEWDPEQSQFASSYPTGRITMSSRVANNRTHKLSLYRHSSGALVFGAGTVQWSWGLDGNHLGGNSSVSPEMQQATVNLFADMGVQPGTLQSDLLAASASSDNTAPAITISTPPNGSSGSLGSSIAFSGTATDAGGVVAAVEVSTDGGVTWHQAEISAIDQNITWTYTWVPEAEGTFTIKVKGTDDSGNSGISGEAVNISIGPDVCPCNIFPPGQAPIKPLDNDHQGINVGVKFQATENGFISGIRYYKGDGTTGTHVGSLWDNTGVQLASATFINETATGWQEVLFSTPVPITAGVTYIASYFSPSGDYASTPFYFTQAAVNGPLRGLADGEDGFNGVFTYGAAPAFPVTEFKSINYWVDVVFTKTSGGIAPVVLTQPLDINLCSPANVSFHSSATGSPVPTVQWQSSTDGTTWTDIPGATTSSYSFNATAADHNKRFRAAWTNAEGTVYSFPALLSTTIPAPPVITVVNNCGNSVLSVGNATGTLAWSNGASGTSITVTTAGNYTVTETINGCTSQPGTATAAPKLVPVLTGSLNETVKTGDPLSYTPAGNQLGIQYQWRRAAVNGISNPAASGTGSIQETLINTTNSPINVVYEYTLTLNGCTNKQNVVVTVTTTSTSSCVSTSSIKYHFNSRRIPAGKTVWFNSSFELNGLPRSNQKDPVTIKVTNAKISFSIKGKQYSLPVPDARIVFTTAVNTATTKFVNNTWETTVPRYFTQDVFMSGLAWQVPQSLPNNVRNIKWTADISIDKPGVSIEWDWGAAVYYKFGSHSDLKIKPVDGWRSSPYLNFDKAGTPVNYKAFLSSGGTGHHHQRRDYTGQHSRDEKVTCATGNNGWHPIKPPFWTGPKQTGPGHHGNRHSLQANIGPNPSRNNFTVTVSSNSTDAVTIIVTDSRGNVMERYVGVSPTSTVRIGDKLKTGLYHVEIIQGMERKTLKILKIY